MLCEPGYSRGKSKKRYMTLVGSSPTMWATFSGHQIFDAYKTKKYPILLHSCTKGHALHSLLPLPRCPDYFFLLFGFLTSFFAPCREAAMCHHPFRIMNPPIRRLLLRGLLYLFNLSFIRRLNRILRWLYCVFIQFALSFFLIFSFSCYFFLTLFKIEIWFRHLVAPFEKYFSWTLGHRWCKDFVEFGECPGDSCIIPGCQDNVYTHDWRRGRILLARERMALDFMNVKEEDNCGS